MLGKAVPSAWWLAVNCAFEVFWSDEAPNGARLSAAQCINKNFKVCVVERSKMFTN